MRTRHVIEITMSRSLDLDGFNLFGFAGAREGPWIATVCHDDGIERIYQPTPESCARIMGLGRRLERRRLYHDPGFEIMRRALASREDALDA